MRKSVALAVATVALVPLAGCAQSPANAAVVDGTPITESTVARLSDRLAEVGGGGVQGVRLRPGVVEALVDQQILQRFKAQNPDVTVPTQTRAQLDAQIGDQLGAADGDLRALLLDAEEFAALRQQLGAASARAFAATPVTVNPHYGAWDPTGELTLSNQSLSKLWVANR